jgi:hypothetical protein
MIFYKVYILEQIYFFMWNTPSKKLLKKIPRLYETENVELCEKLIYLHFFLAGSDWFIAEYDGKDTFFGFVCLNSFKEFAEWGYISFKELKKLRIVVPLQLSEVPKVIWLEVECDKFWKAKKAKDVPLIQSYQS